MRLVSYVEGGGSRAGVLTEAGVVDAGASLRELLADGLDGLGVDGDPVPLGELTLTAPVPDPEKIVCIGLNYRSHAEEAGIDPPVSPTIFAKYRNALAAPGATVALPRASDEVDYEAEVAVVIGRRASSISEDAALEAIAGYTLLNDLSARDLQFATPQWMAGKVFDGSAPCGPALVTPEEAGPHDAISFALELNGERMQEASTGDLIFSVPQLIAHLSTLMTLEPGDIVSTGTPSGVGGTRDPCVWLKAGDEIVISSPTLGELVTRIS